MSLSPVCVMQERVRTGLPKKKRWSRRSDELAVGTVPGANTRLASTSWSKFAASHTVWARRQGRRYMRLRCCLENCSGWIPGQTVYLTLEALPFRCVCLLFAYKTLPVCYNFSFWKQWRTHCWAIKNKHPSLCCHKTKCMGIPNIVWLHYTSVILTWICVTLNVWYWYCDLGLRHYGLYMVWNGMYWTTNR